MHQIQSSVVSCIQGIDKIFFSSSAVKYPAMGVALYHASFYSTYHYQVQLERTAYTVYEFCTCLRYNEYGNDSVHKS